MKPRTSLSLRTILQYARFYCEGTSNGIGVNPKRMGPWDRRALSIGALEKAAASRRLELVDHAK